MAVGLVGRTCSCSLIYFNIHTLSDSCSEGSVATEESPRSQTLDSSLPSVAQNDTLQRKDRGRMCNCSGWLRLLEPDRFLLRCFGFCGPLNAVNLAHLLRILAGTCQVDGPGDSQFRLDTPIWNGPWTLERVVSLSILCYDHGHSVVSVTHVTHLLVISFD